MSTAASISVSHLVETLVPLIPFQLLEVCLFGIFGIIEQPDCHMFYHSGWDVSTQDTDTGVFKRCSLVWPWKYLNMRVKLLTPTCF